jgi:hypothetical protein
MFGGRTLAVAASGAAASLFLLEQYSSSVDV